MERIVAFQRVADCQILLFGRVGYALYHKGYLVQVFNHGSKQENYEQARAWAREHYHQDAFLIECDDRSVYNGIAG